MTNGVGKDATLQRAAVVILELGFVALFGSLLIEAWNARSAVSPSTLVNTVTPVFAGALGLILALSLGVQPLVRSASGVWDRIKAVFGSTPALLRVGAWIYLLAGVAGGIVWGLRETVTPELVKVLVLTAVGYVAAMVTNLSEQ